MTAKIRIPGSGPDADATSILKAGVRELVAKTPLLGSIVKVLAEAETATRERRQAEWCRAIVGDTDEATFAERLKSALNGDEGDVVRAAILESARTAVEAVDEAIIPTIGKLTRRYCETKTPDLQTYRELLSVLRALDHEMLDGLRVAILEVERISGGLAVSTTLTSEEGEPYVWTATSGEDNPEQRRTATLLKGEVAKCLVMTLGGTTSGPFSGFPPWSPPQFTVDLIKTLSDVL